jgi:hypothetical protein
MFNATTDDTSPELGRLHLGRLLLTLVVVVGIGLASRTFARSWSPDWMLLYGGDVLWAAALYGVLLWFLPSRPRSQVLLATVLGAFVIEFSQLYQAPWIQQLRSSAPFNFVLGQGFLISDLVSYLAGALGMALLDQVWLRPRP